jgi:uncharacterized protein YndB with AHSA1/START domain
MADPVGITSDRRYRFEQAPEAVWEAITRVHDYRRWWPWLRQFDAAGVVVGDRWACAVRPPLPYVLRFTVAIETVQAPHRITAAVSGDIAGAAELTVRPLDGEGAELRLTSTLWANQRPLRVVAQLLPQLVRYGHDWVLDTGSRQFRSRALGG